MKLSSTFSILGTTFLTSSILYANNGDFIRQHDYSKNTTKDIYINGPDAGEETEGTLGPNDILPVNSGGAKFELFAVDLQTQELIPEPLDSKLVGLFAQAEINIQSEDPYVKDGVYRTRADEKFYIGVKATNLSSESDAPVAVQKVYAERLYGEYTSDDRLPLNKDGNYTVINAAANDSSFEPAGIYLYADKPVSDETYTTGIPEPVANEYFKQRGEETVRVYAQPAENAEWEVIAEERIQIWPVASASGSVTPQGGSSTPIIEDQDLTDEDQIETYISMPTFSFTLTDLYPTSNTYVVVHRLNSDGSEPSELTDVLQDLADNEAIFNTVTPQSASFTVPESEWNQDELTTGRYRAEVRTITAFNGEEPETILSYVFDYKPNTKVQIRGNVTTSE